ncbi:hypothetical protein [Vibrio taketomensis]|nr:hypothetical protein [Vibrio taketomensis]
MATQLLIYGQVEAVNKKRHLDWSIKAKTTMTLLKGKLSAPNGG